MGVLGHAQPLSAWMSRQGVYMGSIKHQHLSTFPGWKEAMRQMGDQEEVPEPEYKHKAQCSSHSRCLKMFTQCVNVNICL